MRSDNNPPVSAIGARSRIAELASVVQTEASSGVDFDAEVCPTEGSSDVLELASVNSADCSFGPWLTKETLSLASRSSAFVTEVVCPTRVARTREAGSGHADRSAPRRSQ
jgi:hypothetical protein